MLLAITLDLMGGSDTGLSNIDDLTNRNNTASAALTFAVSGTSALGTVTLYADGNAIGSAPGASGTTYVTSDGTLKIPDGSRQFTAMYSWPLPVFTTILYVTIDTVAPSTPGAPDLTSDSGFSTSDNITNDNTPSFGSLPGEYYRFYNGSQQLSNDYEAGSSFTAGVQDDAIHTYTVKTIDAAGNMSASSSGLVVTIDTVAPSAPSAPDLLSDSDSGASMSDNITSDSTPTFGFGAATYFRFYRDGSQISGNWLSGNSYTTPAQSDGLFSFAMAVVDTAGNLSARGPGLTVIIDTVAPSVPVAPDLQATSDSGRLSDDGITNDTTPSFAVPESGYFRFCADGARISGEYEYGTPYTTVGQTNGAHTYTVIAVDTAGNASAQGPGLGVTIDTVAPGVPAAPDLQWSSDSGIFYEDNVTNDSTPTFDLNGASPYFRFCRDAAQISGDYEIGGATYTAPVQSDGIFLYQVQAVDNAGNASARSAGVTVKIDTVAPTCDPGFPRFSFSDVAVQSVQYQFCEIVSGAGSGFSLNNLTTAVDVPLSTNYDESTRTATLTWPAFNEGTGRLTDGNYRASASTGITDIAGNNLPTNSFDFFFLSGDANHDRVVDINDLLILAMNWQGTGKLFSQADFNYDTKVDAKDLGILSKNWQKSLPAAPPPAAPVAAPVRTPTRTARRIITLLD